MERDTILELYCGAGAKCSGYVLMMDDAELLSMLSGRRRWCLLACSLHINVVLLGF